MGRRTRTRNLKYSGGTYRLNIDNAPIRTRLKRISRETFNANNFFLETGRGSRARAARNMHKTGLGRFESAGWRLAFYGSCRAYFYGDEYFIAEAIRKLRGALSTQIQVHENRIGRLQATIICGKLINSAVFSNVTDDENCIIDIFITHVFSCNYSSICIGEEVRSVDGQFYPTQVNCRGDKR